MKSQLMLLLGLVAVASAFNSYSNFIDYEGGPRTYRVTEFLSCSDPDDDPAVTLLGLSIDEGAVSLPGTTTVQASYRVNKNITGPIKADARIERYLLGGVFTVPLPCINNLFGTCKYDDLCEILDRFLGNNDRCPLNIVPPVCTCPIPTGVYSSTDYALTIGEDLLPSAVLWLAKGQYKFKVSAEQNGEVIGCLEGKFEIKKP